MKLTDILPQERVIHRLEATDKTGVLEEMVTRAFLGAEQGAGLANGDRERVIAVLEERESMCSTGIGEGVAIPHGKIPGLGNLAAAIGIQAEGVEFAALDGKPSCFFVVLLAPESSAGAHLKALARISRLFRDASFKKRLLDAPDSEAMFTILAEEDARV
jgi:PTS system nitrogen regulatory IIA component